MTSRMLHSRLLLVTASLMVLGAVFFALSPSIGFLQSVPVNQRVLTLADTNRDGILSVAEMRKSISAMITAIARNTLTYDLNTSGKTDKADLKVLITSIRSFLVAECGNGTVEGSEQCDDGNQINNDFCTGLCKNATCGDGFKQNAELCDDGNRIDTDSCRNTCVTNDCGNGRIDAGEECDDGNTNNADTCSNSCRDAICGDGIKHVNEVCDDGNQSNMDRCTNECVAPYCSNGILEGTEQCDDGNQDTTDACVSCRNAFCGDGVKAATEQCDDANQNNTDDSCTTSCKAPACGDAYLGYFEECEDGNTVAGDGCAPATCRAEFIAPAIPAFTWTTDNPPQEDLFDGSLAEFTVISAFGKMLVIGGVGNGEISDAIYAGGANFWFKIGNLPRALFQVNAVDLNGELWVIGGICQANNCGNLTYRSSDGINWLSGPALPSGVLVVRSNPSFALNGRLFVEAMTEGGLRKTYTLDSGATTWQLAGGSMSGSAVVFREKAWVLSGRSILSSTDGIHFQKVSTLPTSVRTRNETQNFGTLMADHSRLMVVGNVDHPTQANLCAKVVLSSYDGVRWSKVLPSGCTKPLQDHFTMNSGSRMWLISRTFAPSSQSPFSYSARIPLPISLCGDGYRQMDTEQCDDANTDNGDTCTTLCKPPACGDGFKQGSEQCDDGNKIDTDACTSLCKKPFCGNAKIDGTEQCDDANQINTDGCTIACKLPACSDGYLQGTEQCDDGNTDNTDACTTLCKAPFCGDSFKQLNEQCDDGNQVNTDACLNTCIIPVCSNGIIEAAERCDDGNTASLDGCSSVCVVENNSNCFGAPSTCRADKDRMKELADTSHDGTVSEREALVMMLDAAESKTKPFDTVKHFDLNYDGRISQEDLQIIIFQLNSFFPN